MTLSPTTLFPSVGIGLLSRILLLFSLLISSLLTPALAHAQAEEQEVRAAVNGLYRALSDQDATAFSTYLMPQGFTEFNPDWPGVRRLDMKVFKSIFESGAKIDLSVAELQVHLISAGNAVTTGYRVGTITPPGGVAIKSRLALTMIWAKHLVQWKLQHVHLSEEKSDQ